MEKAERLRDGCEKRQKLKSGGGRINHEQKRKIDTIGHPDYDSDCFYHYFYFISGHLCGEHVFQ